MLRDRTGQDFSQYKHNTLVRQVQRRMAIHQVLQEKDYLRFLQKNPPETEALFRDLLIGVTSFFRDPEVFEMLRAQVIPRLFAGRPAGDVLRVWVCGCSTGEEAYSMAIMLQEQVEALQQPYKVQVFATDIDPHSIEKARAGVSPPASPPISPPNGWRAFLSRTPRAVPTASTRASVTCWSFPGRMC